MKTNYFFYFTVFFLIQFNSTLSALATEIELIQDKSFRQGGITAVSPFAPFEFKTYTASDAEVISGAQTAGSYKTYNLNGKTCLKYGLNDDEFKKYLLKYPNTSTSTASVWELGQWGSTAELGVNDEGEVVSTDIPGRNGKAVKFSSIGHYNALSIGQIGSGYRYLSMRINGLKEYGGVVSTDSFTGTVSGHYLTFPTPTSTQVITQKITAQNNNIITKKYTVSADCFESGHPALLLGQPLPVPNSIKPNPKAVSVGQMNSLNLKMTMKVLENYIPERLLKDFQDNQNKMTAHFKIHVKIQNRKMDQISDKKEWKKSPGYGQNMNFSINVFDVRNPDPESAISNNPGDLWFHRLSSSLMRRIPASDFGTDFLKDLYNKRWAKLNIDLLKYLKGNCPQTNAPAGCVKSFAQLVEEHCASVGCPTQPLVSNDLSDYYVTSINFGWEVSSPHNVEMRISDMGLTYTTDTPSP